MDDYQMTRAQHLKWAKDRALEYVEMGQIQYAFDSIMLDLRKHPETENNMNIEIGYSLWMMGHLKTAEQMRHFINGFN